MLKSRVIVMIGVLTAILMTGAVATVPKAAKAPPVKWTSLFDGKTLKGWTNPYAWGKAAAVDGEVHLTTTKSKFFLVTAKQYKDFVFEADVKLPAGKSNSGFMFRCRQRPNKVWGYQAEVDPTARKWSGGLYDEGRRKWFISPNRDKAKSKAAAAASIAAFRKRAGDCFKRDDWNTYRIECRGDSLKISVNGVVTTDVKDSVDPQGFIALQHHGEKGQVYRFRNIRIQEITPADPKYVPLEEKKPPRKKKPVRKTRTKADKTK